MVSMVYRKQGHLVGPGRWVNRMWSKVSTPLWKSNRNVFFRIKFDRDYQISIDCVWYVLKDPLRKLKSAIINRGRVMKHWKKHDDNFAMSSWITELWRRCVSLTIKCAIVPKLLLISRSGEASVLFHYFLVLFWISDNFLNYILLNKWK